MLKWKLDVPKSAAHMPTDDQLLWQTLHQQGPDSVRKATKAMMNHRQSTLGKDDPYGSIA